MAHRLLSAAAARLGASAATIVVPPVASAPTPPAPAPQGEDVDVVTVADANAAIASARAESAATATQAESTRWATVLASDAGKASPTMAAWMLQHNANASSDAIVAQLANMPAAATAAPTPPAPPAPPAPAAITTPLEQTPKIVVPPDANNAETGKQSQADIDKLWDSGLAAASHAGNSFGADLAPGIPRTGN